MINRPSHVVQVLALVVGVAFVHCARAADPNVLDMEALIEEVEEHCGDGAEHCHQIKTKWDLTPGKSTFEVNSKWWKAGDVHYFDLVPWIPFNEMQDPDLHRINPGEKPFSKDDFSNLGGWPVRIDKALFLFGIHNLENADKTVSPHALIYIPYRIFESGQFKDYQFRLFVVHIPETAALCPTVGKIIEKMFCASLVKLQTAWLRGVSADKLNEQARLEADELLKHLFDGIGPPMSTNPNGDPVAKVLFWIFGKPLHNGIIHGQLGGG